MSETGAVTQDRLESYHLGKQPPVENVAKRRTVRHVVRPYSPEEKAGLLNKFDELIKSSVEEQIALERLGLTYDTMYQWHDDLEAKKQREIQFGNRKTT